MSYEMTELLMKCSVDDFEFLNERVDSYVNLTSDAELKAGLESIRSKHSDKAKLELAHLLEREVRYLGSSELAYGIRRLMSNHPVAGVSVHEMIDDVAKVMKVKVRPLGTVEAKLERLARSVAEKTFFALPEEQQRELFFKAGIPDVHSQDFFQKLKSEKARLLPLMFSILGPEGTLALLEGLVVTTLAIYLGKEAAKKLLKDMLGKVPWVAEFLGPVVWGLSLAWWAYDLQGPANRKTIPILVYLGVVGLRDGPEDGEAFYADD